MTDDPALTVIQKRDREWFDGFNGKGDEHLHDHPETECSADRDRHNLLLGYLNLVGRAEAAVARLHAVRGDIAALGDSHRDRPDYKISRWAVLHLIDRALAASDSPEKP